ncbi:Uncharacterised protein [Mesomycoplasma conjunctivae]|uniref:Uncharacterized protein n=1 Tax=Mesomycoplasma conjunctivae (strain ATCC 25834 / NCTC 10147 / HRC/581) TaxID=572263 RepID=C5J718_MESCH|nr:hypothetical protein [Mesomycoplasma conjunctivae]CAT05281.1 HYPOTHETICAL PROTEIN MCJ_005840 [Mesomycoplasma conjunctivae]VEU66511.1 Uncharacterised protein [Mesomycoplasma conjunctivae]
MKKKIVNFLAKTLIFLSGGVAISLISYYKIHSPFKPAVYNYESYISDFARREISKDFNYREFGDVSDFTKAIEDNRTIAGVGSDFQIARLVQKKLLQKIDYSKLFKNWYVAQAFALPENYYQLTLEQKQAFNNKKRAAFEQMFRKEVIKHIDKYDKFLKDDQGNDIDIDHDGIKDRFWEFFIPYYTQDKVIAYTIGDYQKDEKIVNLRQFMNNWTTKQKDEIQNQGIKFDDQSLKGIGQSLRNNGYSFFEWTEAMRDNLLVGQENFGNYGDVIDENNYQKIVDSFVNYISEISGYPYTNLKHNVFKTSGLDLANSLIDPSLNQDVGYLYNGDALDANYSKDNYEILEEEKTIRIIRPKNNLTLLDGWIILQSTPQETTDKFYTTLYNSIFKGEEYSLDEKLKELLVDVEYNYLLNNESEKYEQKQGKGYTFDFDTIPFAANFNFINYTPTFQKSFEFFKKFYFNDETATVKKAKDDEEISIILNQDGNIINDIENLKYDQVAGKTTDVKTLRSLNIYLTQQEQQTLYGNMPTEDNIDEGRYNINYTFIKPFSERLESLIRTYYNLKTKS